MATDRQIAANRHNARRSTGPRSSAGRNRSRRNSYRHGLAAGVTLNAERIKHIERLARKIAGNSTDVLAVECARTLAQAEYELVQIRRSKVALISRVMAFGAFETPDSTEPKEVRRLIRALKRGEFVVPERVEIAAMPTIEPERTAEAIRRALPELIKLDRYERRATARRARAMHILLERQKRLNNRRSNFPNHGAKRSQYPFALAAAYAIRFPPRMLGAQSLNSGEHSQGFDQSSRSSSTRTVGARVYGCGSGTRKRVRPRK